MKDFAKSIHVGNASDVIHRDGDFKIKYNDKENSYELYFNSIYYDTFRTKQQALDKIELYKKRKADRGKVVNARSKEQLLADVKELEKYIKDHPDQGCEKEKRLLGEAKEELDKKYGVLVGNADVVKDGNVWVVLYAEGTKSKEFNSEEEAKKFAAQVGNIKDDAKAKKLYAEMMDAKDIAEEWARATHAQKGDNLESGRKTAEEAYRKAKKAYESYAMNSDGTEKLFHSLEKDVEKKEEKNDEKIEKVGNRLDWSENLVGKYVWVKSKGDEWKCYVMQDKGDKVYIRDDSDGSQGWVSKERITGKVNNSKVGNIASEYEILKQDPSKMHPMYKKAYEEAMKKLAREDEEFKKRFEREYGVKAKNEASDDKFAYVMREFDEGKLKTPDGKVVTDPAQAKAIAYSESKKTENGCARARNAIKK